MSERKAQPPQPGSIVWHDLTVPDAMALKDFYASVIGWTPLEHDCGEYNDFEMQRNGETVAGVCHARDTNANVPPQWLVYVKVASVEECTRRATEAGGAVVDGPRMMGRSLFAVIRDPAGAVIGVIE